MLFNRAELFLPQHRYVSHYTDMDGLFRFVSFAPYKGRTHANTVHVISVCQFCYVQRSDTRKQSSRYFGLSVLLRTKVGHTQTKFTLFRFVSFATYKGRTHANKVHVISVCQFCYVQRSDTRKQSSRYFGLSVLLRTKVGHTQTKFTLFRFVSFATYKGRTHANKVHVHRSNERTTFITYTGQTHGNKVRHIHRSKKRTMFITYTVQAHRQQCSPFTRVTLLSFCLNFVHMSDIRLILRLSR